MHFMCYQRIVENFIISYLRIFFLGIKLCKTDISIPKSDTIYFGGKFIELLRKADFFQVLFFISKDFIEFTLLHDCH